jgi:hypothetical protein
MPAKYLVSKSISCNVTDLRLASEEDLWEEHRDLLETFLKTWKGVTFTVVNSVRSREVLRRFIQDRIMQEDIFRILQKRI